METAKVWILVAWVILGIALVIFLDLYFIAKVKSFRQFQWKRYWQTNQVRIVLIVLGVIVFTLIALMVKQWVDSVIAQFIAILGGIVGTAASKQIPNTARLGRKKTYLEIATAEVEAGVKEIKGAKHHPRIIQYGTDVGFDMSKGDEEAWCSTAANWVVWQRGDTPTKSKKAKSWLYWGRKGTWADTESGNLIAVLRSSHVTFVKSYDLSTGKFIGIGGNQSDGFNATPFKISDVEDLRMPND